MNFDFQLKLESYNRIADEERQKLEDEQRQGLQDKAEEMRDALKEESRKASVKYVGDVEESEEERRSWDHESSE